MRRGPSSFNIAAIVAGLAFLYAPILVLVIYSFNAGRLVTVWAGFSTRWYVELWKNDALLEALGVTLRLGVLSATLATVLGVFAAVALTRAGAFRGARRGRS